MSQANQSAVLRALDENGSELCRTTLGLINNQHGAFILRNLLPCVNGRSGTFEVDTDSAGLTMVAFPISGRRAVYDTNSVRRPARRMRSWVADVGG